MNLSNGLLILSFFVWGCNHESVAQKNSEELIDEFFEKSDGSSWGGSLDYLFATNSWMKDSQEEINQVKLKLDNTCGLLGKYHSKELLTTRRTGTSLILYTYMVKYERQPLRFTFILYKPSDSWFLYNFKFDDTLDADLEEAARLYYLQETIKE